MIVQASAPALAQASAEGVPQRVYHEALRQPKQIPNFAVEMHRRDQIGPARLSRKHVGGFLLTDAGFRHGACPRGEAEIAARVLWLPAPYLEIAEPCAVRWLQMYVSPFEFQGFVYFANPCPRSTGLRRMQMRIVHFASDFCFPLPLGLPPFLPFSRAIC